MIWVVAFAVSVVPNGLTAVLQERLFHQQPDLDIVVILFWSNMTSIIGYANVSTSINITVNVNADRVHDLGTLLLFRCEWSLD